VEHPKNALFHTHSAYHAPNTSVLRILRSNSGKTRLKTSLRNLPLRYLLVLVPAVGLVIVSGFEYTNYTLLLYLTLTCLFLAGVIVVSRGWPRDTALVFASIILCLAVVEGYEAVANPRALEASEGFAESKPILGWGARAPGTFSARKIDPTTGKRIYDTTYTVDNNLLRKTVSADSGPPVAFFGDSFMFGQGLADGETLPQIFSDLEDHQLHVLNFGFPGYGPQQFLRALETRMYDGLLNGARAFVFETGAWHVERTACSAPFTLRAPRYVPADDGSVRYAGPCAEGVARFVRAFLSHSAAYRTLVQPVQGATTRADVDLYVATLLRAVKLAREVYHVRTIVLHLPSYVEVPGYSDNEVIEKLRKGGAEVIDGTIHFDKHPPGVVFSIPGDGHPTGAANRVWAETVKTRWDRNAQASLESRSD
jgi:hypothetical protein